MMATAVSPSDMEEEEMMGILRRIGTLNNVLRRLRDASSSEVGLSEFQLPKLILVSDSRHGASSVMQSLLGLRILPDAGNPRRVFDAGSDVVLPRPLEVTVHHTDDPQPYARLADSPGERPLMRSPRRYNFQEVVDHLADLYIPSPAGDSEHSYGDLAEPTPVYVDIFSKDLPDMQLVQLPGLCRSPRDYASSVSDLVRGYVEDKSAVLVLVVAGDGDISNSSAVALCRDVDHERTRTVGVVTKLDNLNLQQVDATAFQKDLLENNGRATEWALPTHGWTAVLGNFPNPVWRKYRDVLLRGQGKAVDPEDAWTVGDALAEHKDDSTNTDAAWFERLHDVEARFFKMHRFYQDSTDVCGCAVLRRKLHAILVARVRESVPEFRTRIQTMRGVPKAELKRLEPLVKKSKMTKQLGDAVAALSHNWSFQVEDNIQARYGVEIHSLDTESLAHKLERCVYKELRARLRVSYPTDVRRQIALALEHTRWYPERQAWQRVALHVVTRMIRPCKHAVDKSVHLICKVVAEMKTILAVSKTANAHLLGTVVCTEIQQLRHKAREFITLLVSLEGYYPDFTTRRIQSEMDKFAAITAKPVEGEQKQLERPVFNTLVGPAARSPSDICAIDACRQLLPRYRFKRHHCRYCGITVCGRHSSHTAPVLSNAAPVRVCDPCYKLWIDYASAPTTPQTLDDFMEQTEGAGAGRLPSRAEVPTMSRRELEAILDEHRVSHAGVEDPEELARLVQSTIDAAGGTSVGPGSRADGDETKEPRDGFAADEAAPEVGEILEEALADTHLGSHSGSYSASGAGTGDDGGTSGREGRSRSLADDDDGHTTFEVSLEPLRIDLTEEQLAIVDAMERVIRVYAECVADTLQDQVQKTVYLLVLDKTRTTIFDKLASRVGPGTTLNRKLRRMMVHDSADIKVEINRLQAKVDMFDELLRELEADFPAMGTFVDAAGDLSSSDSSDGEGDAEDDDDVDDWGFGLSEGSGSDDDDTFGPEEGFDEDEGEDDDDEEDDDDYDEDGDDDDEDGDAPGGEGGDGGGAGPIAPHEDTADPDSAPGSESDSGSGPGDDSH